MRSIVTPSFLQTFKTKKMKFSELTSLLESSRMIISQSKLMVSSLMDLQRKEVDEKELKNFDSAINSIGKMLSNVFDKVGYTVDLPPHTNENSLYRGGNGLKNNYNPATEMSKVITNLNGIESELKKLGSKEHAATHQRIINHGDMLKVVELDKKYFSALKAATTSVSSIISYLKDVTF